MKNSAGHSATFLGLFFLLGALFLPALPAAHAFESTKIVLPAVNDRSGYNSRELNAALLGKLRSQFRFPKYEVIFTESPIVAPDRPALEKIAAEQTAEGVVALEIIYLRNHTFQGFFNDEIYEDTYLELALTYFDKSSGKYGQFKTHRSATQIMGVDSGPLPLALDALEELLNRLDKIFPRQFPGPRY